MSPIDPTTLLRELRPAADARPDEDALERLLSASPEPAPPTRSRLVRPVAIVGTLAVVATAGVALAPGGGGPGVPGIVERATAAMTKPDTILHYRATVTSVGPDGQRRVRTIESWQTTDGRRERTIFDGGLETARNAAARTFQTYDPDHDRVVRHADPAFFAERGSDPSFGAARGTDRVGLAGGGFAIALSTVGDLPALLRRARDGAEGTQLLGRTEIDGVAVEQVRITGTMQVLDEPRTGARVRPEDLRGRSVTTTRDVSLRVEDALPVRVVDRGGLPSTPELVIDYLEAEQVPLDASTGRLLELGPHPGATVRDASPVG